MKRAWTIGVVASLAVLVASCSGDEVTELLVVVDSNLSVPGELDRVRVEVDGSMSLTATGDLTGSRAEALPRTVGVVHEGGPSGPITVRAVGVSAGADVVERSATTHFRIGQTLVLQLFLDRSCMGVTCPDGQTCSGGSCSSNAVDPGDLPEWDGTVPRIDGGSCMPVAERCNGMDDDCDGATDEDFDLDSDPLNCGGCGNACNRGNAMTTCTAGECEITGCLAGFDDCNGDLADGCENTLDTADACGACDVSCTYDHGVGACMDSACSLDSCEAQWDDCNDDPSDGCERSLETVTDCGACDTPCEIPGAVETCAGGTCGIDTCEDLVGDCNSDETDGCERPLDTLTDCGGCDVACSVADGTATCATGTCEVESCDAGFGDCNTDPADGCEQTLDTLTHCSACDTPCTNDHGTAACDTGTCVVTCDADWDDCDGDPFNGCETDLRRTDAHCGMCDNACPTGETCRPAGGGTCG